MEGCENRRFGADLATESPPGPFAGGENPIR